MESATMRCSKVGCLRQAKAGDIYCGRHRAAVARRLNLLAQRRSRELASEHQALYPVFLKTVRQVITEAEERFSDPQQRWIYLKGHF